MNDSRIKGAVADKEVELILTRSIRRKLVIGLALVFAMLVLLSLAGLWALYGFADVVEHFRFSLEKEPQQASLAAALAGLSDPLIERQALNSLDQPQVPQTIQVISNAPPKELKLTFVRSLWDHRKSVVNDELRKFRARLNALPKTPEVASRLSPTVATLDLIKFRLDVIEQKKRQFSADQLPDENGLKSILLDVLELQALVQQIPNPEEGFERTLRDANDAIEWERWVIGTTTVIVILLFFGLTYFGYHWILIPIRKLHDAASRVANGDFTYRLKLRGKDEMVELSEMFNKMTARFQTDKTKLAREVEERSRQLLRSERLAGIGYFASGISHEINNPLQAIGAAAESLTGRLSDGSLGQELPLDDRELLETYLKMIERESSRCQQITSRVLDFARGTNGPKTRQDLTKIVMEVLEMVTHMSKFDQHQIIFDRNMPHLVDVSAAEMKQVVLNLVANGLESMAGPGTLVIQITELVDEVLLTIQDNGCGMTPAVIENLYEPFFTDKLNGKGTGLGLSITHRIVGDHGGRIEANSDGPGHGSTFQVHLPRCAKSANITAA